MTAFTGQVIQPNKIQSSSSHLDILDYAAKVAISSSQSLASTTATQLLNHNPKVPRITETENSSNNAESIVWLKFDDSLSSDFSNPRFLSKLGQKPNANKPSVLIIGYTTGYSIWLVAKSSPAYEILSMRSGPVNHVKIIPTPSGKTVISSRNIEESTASTTELDFDPDKSSYPHIAHVAAGSLESAGQLIITSLVEARTQVQDISFPAKIENLLANKKFVVVYVENGNISGFIIAQNYAPAFSLDIPPFDYNAISLSSRWLAFPESKRLNLLSKGGVETSNDTNSVTSSVIKTFSTLMSIANNAYKETTKNSSKPGSGAAKPEIQESFVTVVDTDTLASFGLNQNESISDENGENRPVEQSVLFHFPAHRLREWSEILLVQNFHR